MAAPAVGAVVRSAGQYALNAVKEMGPEALAATKDYIKESGTRLTAEKLATGTVGEQALVMKAAVRNGGLQIDQLMRGLKELTAQEQAQFASTISALRESTSKQVDSKQMRVASTGNARLDAAVSDARIKRICEMTGWSSDFFGEMIDAIHTVRHQDIEDYQRDSRVRGERPV